jgi:hypothetical protein
VAVTVSPVRPKPRGGLEPLPVGVTRRRTRLVEVLDPAGFTDEELAGQLAVVADARAQLAAYEAGLVASFAGRRPAQTDLTGDQPGHGVEGYGPGRVAADVSEFVADELALVTNSSLPATWEALADGLVDESRAKAIVRVLAGQSESAGGPVHPAVVAEVEAQALEWALAGETPARLQERTAAALIAVDGAAADRRRKKAERAADVTTRRGLDGMSQLVGDMPSPVAAACRETVDTFARMLKADGDARPIGQLRALVLADLVLRPWDSSRPPVTAHLTVLAPLSGLSSHRADDRERPPAAPTDVDTATVDGAPITAAQLRELLEQLDAVCPGGLQAPTGGTMDLHLTDPATGALRATVTRAELARLVRRGCPEHPRRQPSRAAGRPEAPDGASAGCGRAVLDRPAAVDRYTPSPAQYRYVRARDRTCRHPGCRTPAARTDLDHVTAHADGGQTDCQNLCCLCRRHHRLKTHARHWRHELTPDGTLLVTTPSGVTRTTRPPGLHLPERLLLTGHHPAQAPADDPPPF